jgi:RimJ/RimL family protein N-acetyltransferase
LHRAFDVLGAERVINVIHPDNAASIRVAPRPGETAAPPS